MEDVLTVYERSYDSDYPVVCMDEKPFQLTDERYEPLPMSQTNRKLKYDCEYERKGTCSIFMFTEPLAGWRNAEALPHVYIQKCYALLSTKKQNSCTLN